MDEQNQSNNEPQPQALEGGTSQVVPTTNAEFRPTTPASTAPVNHNEPVLDVGQGSNELAQSTSTAAPPPPKPPFFKRIWSSLKRLNLWMVLLFAIMIIVGVLIFFVAKKQDKTNSSINSQNLSQNSINQLANNNTSLGASNQTLNVASSTIFAGQVSIKGNLQVAGALNVGGPLSLTGLTVSGSTALNQVQTTNLTVGGTLTALNNLNVQKNLTVSGTGTFSGNVSAPQVTVNNLVTTGDLTVDHHLLTSGGVPSKTNGTALGGGGTASVSGTDTSGSITLNTGSGPVVGCFVTITFTKAFASTPHVIVSPVNQYSAQSFSGAALEYYVTKSSGGFSVCTANAAAAQQSFGFDYIVLN